MEVGFVSASDLAIHPSRSVASSPAKQAPTLLANVMHSGPKDPLDSHKEKREVSAIAPTCMASVSGRMTEIILPVIHLNGTAADRLITDLQDAADALDKAYAALKETAPNGRDYYTVPGLMPKAEAQHRRRLLAVDELKTELESAILAIDDRH